MEPQIHPIEKENHLNQTIIFRFYVNLRGCIYWSVKDGEITEISGTPHRAGGLSTWISTRPWEIAMDFIGSGWWFQRF